MQAPEFCTEFSPCFAEATVVWWLPGGWGSCRRARGFLPSEVMRTPNHRLRQQLHDSPGLLKTPGLDDPSGLFVQCMSCTQSSCFCFFI